MGSNFRERITEARTAKRVLQCTGIYYKLTGIVFCVFFITSYVTFFDNYDILDKMLNPEPCGDDFWC